MNLHFGVIESYIKGPGTRAKNGSNDPGYICMGHFFDMSSGSHLQTKMSGCDLDD